jgi:LacI family transcriptional regulator
MVTGVKTGGKRTLSQSIIPISIAAPRRVDHRPAFRVQIPHKLAKKAGPPTTGKTQAMSDRKDARSAPAAGEAPRSGDTDRHKKRPTINDIARLANVSKKTVSRVINRSPYVREETRQRIAAIIDEVGFEPDPQARGLALRRSFLIGLVYDNPNAQYIVNIEQGMLDGMRGTGFELVVHPCAQANANFLADVRNFVERQKLFGVVLLPPVSENEALVAVLRDIDCPYVRIACANLDKPDCMIVSHDQLGAAQAADHFVARGHTRIAFITGPAGYRSSHERRAGFSRALERHGLTLDPALVLEGAYSFESGVECGAVLCRREPRPTAIFASNDEMAAGVYRAARAQGLNIPDDLSIIGYDDSPLATRIWPPLTTVHVPIPDMGKLAAERLLVRRRETARLEAVEIVPALVERNSVRQLGE